MSFSDGTANSQGNSQAFYSGRNPSSQVHSFSVLSLQDDSFQTTIPSQSPSSARKPLGSLHPNTRRLSLPHSSSPTGDVIDFNSKFPLDSKPPPVKRVRLTLHPPKKRVRLFLRPPKKPGAPPLLSPRSSVPSSPLSSKSSDLGTPFVALSSESSVHHGENFSEKNTRVDQVVNSPIGNISGVQNENTSDDQEENLWDENPFDVFHQMLLNEAEFEAAAQEGLFQEQRRRELQQVETSNRSQPRVQTRRRSALENNHVQTREEQQTRTRSRVYKAFSSEYIVERVKQVPQFMTDICNHCGALHWIEERVSGSSEYESCCKRGDVKLDSFEPPPPLLQNLLTARTRIGRQYRKHLRQYNSALAFISVNYRADTRVAFQGQGPKFFMIQGDLYHMGGPLAPSDDQPRFAQLFFYDPEEATSIRTKRHSNLNSEVMRQLTEMLYTSNPFIELYKTANETLRDNASGNDDLRIILSPQMRLVMEAGADRRRENLPTSNEVAAIIIDEYGDPCERDIVLTERVNGANGTSMKRISQNHAAYMPLHYVLLFPHGDRRWHWGLRINSNSRQRIKNRLCQRAFYRYRLHMRHDEFSVLHHSRRLFQQYVVDSWASCDLNKLDWLRTNQTTIRADLYNGLADSLQRDENADTATLGKRFILPSSYTGGDRYMQQLYQDSMALVRHFGRPDLFITFTANPNWPDIKEALKNFPESRAENHPEIVVRAFRLRQKRLLEELKRGNIFGRFRGCVWTYSSSIISPS